MRVLLVEPDPAARSAIQRWLDDFFCPVEVETAASGAGALKILERCAPELVLAAHPIPAPGAFELAAAAKARRPDAAFVVMTSVPAAGFDLPCRAARVDFWLEKRQLQALLLGFLQQRFPRAWAAGVAERSERYVR
jgi:CheY-like chemotaxis protein